MTDWTVTIDTEVMTPVTDELLIDLVDKLQMWGGAVSGADTRIGATLTVPGFGDVHAAAGMAVVIIEKALANAGLGTMGHVALEAMTVDEADRRLAEATIPELVGASEVGDMLGISRQRVHQLHNDHPGFPTPVVEVRMGPLWTKASIEAFDRGWTRKPGRRAATPPAADDDATATKWHVIAAHLGLDEAGLGAVYDSQAVSPANLNRVIGHATRILEKELQDARRNAAQVLEEEIRD